MKLSIFTVLMFFKASSFALNNHSIIRPFGFPNRQPPSTNSVRIIDFKMGLEAQQVCGYTDWTTASLTVPKHLMSKQYWSRIGKKIEQQARKVILDISGALPGMLACNISPTWCNILNKNQLLAAFESQLTFDSCKVLEGVGNVHNLQATQLKDCIKSKTSTRSDITPGMAREECLVNPHDSDGATSKKDKIARTAGQSKKSFSMQGLLSDLFPDKVTSKSGVTIPLNTGGKIYSRRVESLRLAKKLFPGVEIEGSATTVVGGTFQPTIEEELADQMSELKIEIVKVMREMFLYRDQGFSPIDIIKKASHLWADKSKWRKNKKPHPFYRSTSDGSAPSFLITPEQVLMLLPIADRTSSNLMTSELSQIIDAITRSVSTVKMTDNLSDLYTRTLDTCKRSPKYQEVVAQSNCSLILEKTKAQLEILHLKSETEQKARQTQVAVADLVESIQRDRERKSFRPLIERAKKNQSRIKMPWEIN